MLPIFLIMALLISTGLIVFGYVKKEKAGILIGGIILILVGVSVVVNNVEYPSGANTTIFTKNEYTSYESNVSDSGGSDGSGSDTTYTNASFDLSQLANTGNVDIGAHNFSVDSSVLFVNSVNDRVGIKDTTPSYPLDVAGDIGTTGNLKVQRNSGISSVGEVIFFTGATRILRLLNFGNCWADNIYSGFFQFGQNNGFFSGNNGAVLTRFGISSLGTMISSLAYHSLPVPQNMLDVDGAMVIGDSYAGVTGNISATGYIERTSKWDKSKDVWNYIKDSDYYLKEGKIDHKKYYGYAGSFNVTDYSRPVKEEYQEKKCEEISVGDKTSEPIVECINVTKIREIYPYTIQEEGVLLDKEIDLLRQGVYELKQENDLLKTELCKKDSTYIWCKIK